MFHYWAFGLAIVSEIEFPELFEVQEGTNSVVKIRSGLVPAIIENTEGYNSDFLGISPEQFLYHIPGIASYFVENGKTITISIDQDADLNEMRLYCLSNAFAALLHQRGLIPLHAAAFLHEEEIIMLMGSSGAGKSTTLAALIDKGYDPFSDDICVPLDKKINGCWHAFSSYPMMKYWADTFEKVNLGNMNDQRRLKPALDKYGMFFHEKFITSSRRIKLIILLEKDSNVEKVSSRVLTGIEAFDRLQAEAYRREYLGYENMIQNHFKVLSSMADGISIILVTRPSNKDSVAEVVGSIESILLNQSFL